MALARIWSIARFTKRAARLRRSPLYQNCAAFDELRNIWSIALRTCNRVRVKVEVRTRVRVRVLGAGLGLVLELGLG